jgi:HEAT repeat protein
MVEAAAAALGALKAKKELIKAYDETEGLRRRAVVIGMAKLPGKDVRSVLIRAANDEDPAVVMEAADALAARGVVDALPVLIRLLEVDSAIWLGAHASLKRRTGVDFGRNPPRWWEWYERNKNRLDFDRAAGAFRAK